MVWSSASSPLIGPFACASSSANPRPSLVLGMGILPSAPSGSHEPRVLGAKGRSPAAPSTSQGTSSLQKETLGADRSLPVAAAPGLRAHNPLSSDEFLTAIPALARPQALRPTWRRC